MAEAKDGCVKPTAGVILPEAETPVNQPQMKKEVPKMLAKVGKTAPDFELSAFLRVDLRISVYRITKENGLSSASIRVTSPLSDRLNCRQLPSNILNYEN